MLPSKDNLLCSLKQNLNNRIWEGKMEFAIRVTDYCNLNCQYCYARVSNPKNMRVETLDRALGEVAGLSDEPVTISWTGGEPLTMGHTFFESIARTQARLGAARFTNILQSNLILLNARHVRFLSEHGFQVRTSLDLPPENHDTLRRDGDFARALASVKLLKSANVPVNINTVVTGRNIDLVFVNSDTNEEIQRVRVD